MNPKRFTGRLLGFEAAALNLESQIALLNERLATADATISMLDARVREREATVREREAAVRECERLIDTLKAAHGPAASWPQAGDDLDDSIDTVLPRLEGWCTPRKAHWLAALVRQNQALRIGEIGVYGGRSLLPMALAARQVPGASVWAVEPWSNDIAVALPTDEANDQWWREVDMAKIKRGFFEAVQGCGLTSTIKILELPSNLAHTVFQQEPTFRFDLLHIDGSHAEAQALADVKSWLPMVAPGGIIVLDDIGWDSVAKARDHLRAVGEIVDEVRENDGLTSYGAYRVNAAGLSPRHTEIKISEPQTA